MPFPGSIRAYLSLVVAMTVVSGCSGGSTETGSSPTPSESHASRNREMEDFMKKQAAETQPAR